ncbi:unnamed protein product [Paramecium sonneborni]|uniref:Uncharacterized protein n=1 Tax=Paramecium sonneborni TaxID=65129 RepID=A0A8S1RKW4_9CILI|nr:unnamed protein product [Paramecium sonneborni]
MWKLQNYANIRYLKILVVVGHMSKKGLKLANELSCQMDFMIINNQPRWVNIKMKSKLVAVRIKDVLDSIMKEARRLVYELNRAKDLNMIHKQLLMVNLKMAIELVDGIFQQKINKCNQYCLRVMNHIMINLMESRLATRLIWMKSFRVLNNQFLMENIKMDQNWENEKYITFIIILNAGKQIITYGQSENNQILFENNIQDFPKANQTVNFLYSLSIN